MLVPRVHSTYCPTSRVSVHMADAPAALPVQAAPRIRVAFATNAGPRAAKPNGAPSLIVPDGAVLLAEAIKKLRLKKKEASAARMFLWTKDERAGAELPKEGSLENLLKSDDLVVVSFGEAYQGPRPHAVAPSNEDGTVGPSPTSASSSRWLRWESRENFAVVEWSDALTMNTTLARMSTLLEHPTLCGEVTCCLVNHERQRSLPSSSYLGHNLYAATFNEFERLAAIVAPAPTSYKEIGAAVDVCDSLSQPQVEGQEPDSNNDSAPSAAERGFLQLWRERGAPEVVISFVTGSTSTLAHELCHARFALDALYRQAVGEAWNARESKLSRWMGDLGYHSSRHADEFGAYVLTEAPSFWRGRVPPEEIRTLRTALTQAKGTWQPSMEALELSSETRRDDLRRWFSAGGDASALPEVGVDDPVNAGGSAVITPVGLSPPLITGQDDSGRTFSSLSQLWEVQAQNAGRYYAANDAWWDDSGYGGSTDEEAMIGDGGSDEDLEHSRSFLDALRAARPSWQLRNALDCGAGVGRVTKHVLLRRCEHVCLVEPNGHWLTQSRRYLGKKRALRCNFVRERIEDHAPSCAWEPSRGYDLIWVQWTFQYLIDAHVVRALRRLRDGLCSTNGMIIVKENRPHATPTAAVPAVGPTEASAAPDAAPDDLPRQPIAPTESFRVDTPEGPHQRYDVTRPDAHHRWLFRCAGLRVEACEHCINGECTAWALTPAPNPSSEIASLEQPLC